MAEPPLSTPAVSRHDPYAAFRHAGYRRYAIGWLSVVVGTQIQSVALQWEIYVRTGNALALGVVGLVQIIPALIFLLPGGHVADAYDRRRVIIFGMLGTTLTSVALAVASIQAAAIGVIYGLLFLDASFIAMARPARAAMLPLVVPEAVFGNAVTWNSSLMQLAMMVGPGVGGVVVGIYAPAAYLISAAGSMTFVVMLMGVTVQPQDRVREPVTMASLLEGFRFMWHSRLVLAAISLDMLAVLLGGAVYLLPIFAKDILQVGEWGFGALRAAPAVGAVLTAVVLAHAPPMKHAGRNMLLAVAGFGAATIVFGLSQWFWLSLLMLVLTGVFDNVSVVVRHTLVQLATPDQTRGRVSAVNGVFIGLSNELGGFESGVVARAFGPVVSAVSGGVGTILIVIITAIKAPGLRRLKRLSDIYASPGA